MPNVTSPLLRQQYPHLRPEESRLLRYYLEERGVESVERLRTQVRVGQGEIVDNPSAKYRELARDLSRWKIDAVIDWPGYTEIIELKSRITHTAAGQLVAYSNTLGAIDSEPSTFRLTAVGFRSHPDLLDGLRGTGVRIHVIPQADATTASR